MTVGSPMCLVTDRFPLRVCHVSDTTERDPCVLRCGLDEGGVLAVGQGVREDGVHVRGDPGDGRLLLQPRGKQASTAWVDYYYCRHLLTEGSMCMLTSTDRASLLTDEKTPTLLAATDRASLLTNENMSMLLAATDRAHQLTNNIRQSVCICVVGVDRPRQSLYGSTCP